MTKTIVFEQRLAELEGLGYWKPRYEQRVTLAQAVSSGKRRVR